MQLNSLVSSLCLFRKAVLWLASITLLLTGALSYAAPLVEINRNDVSVAYGAKSVYAEDRTQAVTFEDLQARPDLLSWQAPHNENLNFGYSKSYYWLHSRFHNNDSIPLDRLIEVSYAVLDYLNVYVVTADGSVTTYTLGDYTRRQIAVPVSSHPSPQLYFPSAITGG